MNIVTYLETLIRFCLGRPRRDPSKMGLHLMVREEIIMSGFFPLRTVVVVFLVIRSTLLLIINLTNQQGNILPRVFNGRLPLVLKILVLRNYFAIELQFRLLQQAEACYPYPLPMVRVSFITEI